MEEKLCEVRHKRLDEKIDTHERRINDHSKRIDTLELVNGKLEERIGNLITQLASLNTTIKWFMGLMIASFVGFFFYAVQSGLFG